MLRRHGLSMESISKFALEEELAMRARACLHCENRAECVDRLNSDEKPVYRDICPNAAFIDGLSGKA